MEASTSVDSPYSCQSSRSEEERLCRVCCAKSDGAHFSIDACRACAAFFRRSVVMKKNYVCRQGGNKCKIYKIATCKSADTMFRTGILLFEPDKAKAKTESPTAVRCMCRKCRLAKCLQEGMRPEHVQNRRDPITTKSAETDTVLPFSISEPSTSSSYSSSDECETKKQTVLRPIVVQPVNIIEPSPENSKNLPSLLIKIQKNYELLKSVRRALEVTSKRQSISPLSAKEIPDYTPSRYCEVFRYENEALPAIADFVTRTFPEYAMLSQDERWTVYQNFVVMINCLESAYRTASLWKHEDVGTTYHLTETTFVHKDSVEEFFDMKMNHPHEALSMIRGLFTGPRMKLAKQIYEIQLREEEYAALMTLCMWHSNLENSTENIDRIGRRLRKEMYSQLHLFYKWKGVERYADRIGEVLNLVSSVLFCTSKYLVNIEICNLIDAFGEDKLLFNILRNQKPAQFSGS